MPTQNPIVAHVPAEASKNRLTIAPAIAARNAGLNITKSKRIKVRQKKSQIIQEKYLTY